MKIEQECDFLYIQICQLKLSDIHNTHSTQEFDRPNLIFWIMMGCGKARFGWKGQKTPKIEHLRLKFCSLGPRGDQHMRPRGNPRWDLEANDGPKYEVWAIAFFVVGSF